MPVTGGGGGPPVFGGPVLENARALGRIGGPLLADNLRRNGIDLAFENDLLYLDVTNGIIGVRDSTPARTLDITDTTNISDLIQVDNQATIANLKFLGHEISNLTNRIYLTPNQSIDPAVHTTKISTANLEFSNSLIENITLNSDINLTANGTGQVKFTTSLLDVDGSLHATGDITWDGDVTFGSGADDNVEFKADIDSNIIPNINDAYDLGSSSQKWKEIFVDSYYIGTTTVDNISVIQTLLSKGTTNFSGPSHTFGDSSSDLIEFNGSLLNSWIPAGAFTFGNSSTPLRWDTGYFNNLTIDGITKLTSNNVTTLTTDTDLELSANGTGKVHFTDADIQINNNLTVVGNTTVNGITSLQDTEITGVTTLTGDYGQTSGNTHITGTFINANVLGIGPTSYLEVANIKINGSEISATALNDDLAFVGQGTGGVIVENWLKFKDNELSNVKASPTTDTDKSIIFAPNGTGNVNVDATNAMILPLGNTSTRVLSQVGELRYNTNANIVEGWSPNGRVYLNNVYDGDRNTYITPELTFGANDNTLRFGINGTVTTTIDSTKLYNNTMYVDNVKLSSSTINLLDPTYDLSLDSNGTGSVLINSIPFKDNTITNVTNSTLTFESTGLGYVKFAGTGALAIPYGDDTEKPSTSETGMLRYSTSLEYLEVYDGINWIPCSGTSLAATEAEVEEIMNLWAIILG